MNVKKFNLGFLKIERHVDDSSVKKQSKFIQIETKKGEVKDSSSGFIKIEKAKPDSSLYKAEPETSLKINIVPKELYSLLKKEEVQIKKQKKPALLESIIKEIRILFTGLAFFDAMITASILFLLSFIILMIFVINKWFALILPAAYLAAYFFKRIKYNRYIQVEQKFPILNEKLRTAVDNAYVENEIVNNLRNEVYRDIKQVDYASFFKEKRTSYKVMCVILLCFTIMFVAQHNFEFNLDFLKDRILGFVDGGNGNTTNIIGDIISATTKGPDEDIYGEEELAELGNQKVTIQINKVGYELNVNDIKDPSETEFEESLFPDDLGMAKAEIYNKNILKENQEIVKNYFKNMANN